MNRFLLRTAPCLALILGVALPARTEEEVPEYLLKAHVIEAFSHYVSWPDQIEKGMTTLTVVGYSPFEKHLDATFKSAETNEKGSTICYAKNPALICDSKILFICSSESAVLPQILEKVKGKPVLTISDTPGFALRGVMVNLGLKGKRVTFEINLRAVQDAKLRISSHVLNRAQIVEK